MNKETKKQALSFMERLSSIASLMGDCQIVLRHEKNRIDIMQVTKKYLEEPEEDRHEPPIQKLNEPQSIEKINYFG